MSYFNQVGIQGSDTFSIDAFGRWRISEPFTIFDSKTINDSGSLFWDVSGSGNFTSSFNTNGDYVQLSVSASSVGRAIRQTKRRFNYQPGKSQLYLITGTLNSGSAGLTKMVGAFDDKNGLYYMLSGSSFYVGKRSYSTGVAVDTVVSQSAFNIDKMDGTGPSGINLNFANSQIFYFDYEWLGVGRVRMGTVYRGVIYYMHQFTHSNESSGVYISSPNLPVRWEIKNDGTGPSDNIKAICCSVMSEGGVQPNGVARSVQVGPQTITTNTTAPIIGVRLNSNYLDLSVVMSDFSLIADAANRSFKWTWQVNPTLTGTPTWISSSTDGVEYATGSAALTFSSNGFIIDGTFVSLADSGIYNDFDGHTNGLRLGSKIDGTQDQMWLIATPISNNTNFYSSLTWNEL